MDTIEQYLQEAEKLLESQKILEAYAVVTKILNVAPENNKALKLKGKIDDQLTTMREELIGKKIKELENLFEKKQFEKVLHEAYEILKYDPNNGTVTALLLKAKKQFIKSGQEEIQGMEKNIQNELEQLLDTDKDQEFLKKSTEYLLKYNKVQSIGTAIHALRAKLVEKELRKHEDFLSSSKYDEITNYLEKLNKIEEQSELLQQYLKKTRIKKISQQKEEQREFMYHSKQSLNTLMNLGKWEKALKVADEIISMSPNSFWIGLKRKKCLKKVDDMMQKQLIKEMKNERQNMKKEKEQNPEKFIKL